MFVMNFVFNCDVGAVGFRYGVDILRDSHSMVLTFIGVKN